MNNDNIKRPKFQQLSRFASELLLILTSGKDAPVETICDQIDAGTIVEYISNQFGFKNINDSLEIFCDIDSIMCNKYVSESEAGNLALANSGIGYLISLILDDLTNSMYNMLFNGIDPDSYRSEDK